MEFGCQLDQSDIARMIGPALKSLIPSYQMPRIKSPSDQHINIHFISGQAVTRG